MKCTVCQKERLPSKLRSCIKCGDEGPYCLHCSQCKTCKLAYPGNWECGEGETLTVDKHYLVPGGFMATCGTCDDEFYYCRKCVTECACGVGELHYVCVPYSKHQCYGYSCKKHVCEKNGTVYGQEGVWCAEHRPKAEACFEQKIKNYLSGNKRARDEIKAFLI